MEEHNRGAIEPRSWRFHHGIASTGSDGGRSRSRITIDPRSWPDRGMIVASFEANLRKISPQIREQRRRARESLPRPPLLPSKSGLIFPLKACISPLCSSTFDRFVKELSEFRGRSLVHRDPPVFRLDCEAIGAGLITNFSLISSNFPLQFRTSARKNPSKFTSIHKN